jgi:hypothetical protein
MISLTDRNRKGSKLSEREIEMYRQRCDNKEIERRRSNQRKLKMKTLTGRDK